jgi:hypothetical protein
MSAAQCDGASVHTVEGMSEPGAPGSPPAAVLGGHGIGEVLVQLLVHRQAQQEMPTNVANLKRHRESQQPYAPT